MSLKVSPKTYFYPQSGSFRRYIPSPAFPSLETVSQHLVLLVLPVLTPSSNPLVSMMLVSTSRFLALLALVASVAAAPASSSVATTSGGQSSSTAPTHSATTTKVRSSTTTTTTPPVSPDSSQSLEDLPNRHSCCKLITNTQTNGIVTEITIGSLVKSSISGSQVLVTSSIVETVTLFPQSVYVPSPTPTTPTIPAVTTSSQAATATLRTNGSPARIGGGMGLAAIVGVAGVVAAVL